MASLALAAGLESPHQLQAGSAATSCGCYVGASEEMWFARTDPSPWTACLAAGAANDQWSALVGHRGLPGWPEARGTEMSRDWCSDVSVVTWVASGGALPQEARYAFGATISDRAGSICFHYGSDLTCGIERTLCRVRALGTLIPEPTLIRRYLTRHSDMTELVGDVCDRVARYFGARAQVSLERFSDPEGDEEFLVVNVRQQTYEADLMDEIDALCGRYEQKLAQTTGWLLISTDFCPPR